MFSLRSLGLFAFLFFVVTQSQAGVGFSDWQCITPGGNTIDNYSGKGISLFLYDGHNYRRLENLERWYFYKSFIVCEQKGGWLIINEKSLKVDSFKNDKLWMAQIARQHLKPHIRTRWYTGNWLFYDDLGFNLLMFFPLSILFFLLFSGLLYAAIRYEKLNIKKPFTIILLTMIAIVAFTYLAELFPQSL